MALGVRETLLDRLVVELASRADLKGLEKFDKAAEALTDRLDRVGKVAMGIGAVASAALAGAIASFASVEAKAAEVAAKTGLSLEHIRDTYSDALRDIQRETGRSDAELYDGLQKALSAGLEGAGALDAVREAARSAAAGIGSISDQVSAATTLMGAFEVEASTALDVVARAAQVGEGETQHFANSLKGLAALGESLGFDLYNVAGGLSSISRSAKSVSEGETQFRAFFSALSGRSRAGAKMLEELGLSFEMLREMGEKEGLAPVVGTIKTITGGDIEELTRMLGSVEAVQFVLNTDAIALRELTADIRRTAPGAIADAFEEGAELATRKLEQLRTNVVNIFEDIGRALDPLVRRVLDTGLRATDAVLALPDALKTATAYAGLFLAAFLPLGGIVRLLASMKATTGLLSRALAAAAVEAGVSGKGIAGTGKAAKEAAGKIGLLSRLLPLVLNPGVLVAAGAATLALIVSKWDEVRAMIRRAWSAVTDYFSADRRNRDAASERLDAQGRLVETLEKQLELMREQGAAAGELADQEQKIADAKALQSEYDQRVRALETLRELKVAQEVELPNLADDLAGTRAERAELQAQLDYGFSPGSLGLPLSEEQRVTISARIAALETEESVKLAELETLRLQTEIGLDAIAQTDDDRLMKAGAASYRAFGKGLEAAVPGLGSDIETTLEAAFGPYLPQSDAARGPLSRLTEAGRAAVETLAAGMRDADPITAALMAALALPALDRVNQLVEVEQPDRAAQVVEHTDRISQVVEQVIRPASTAMEEIVLPMVSDLPNMAEHSPPVAPPVSFFDERARSAPARSAPSYTLNIESGAIRIEGADGDAREIADRTLGVIRNEWRAIVEEADNQIDA